MRIVTIMLIFLLISNTASMLSAEEPLPLDDQDIVSSNENVITDAVLGDDTSQFDTASEELEVDGIKVLATQEDAKWLCELFMLTVVSVGIKEAFDGIKPYFAIPESEFLRLEMKTMEQFALIKPRYGDIIGYKLVSEEVVGGIVLRFTYLQQCEKHAVRWLFYFYKPEDTWTFNEFYFDDDLKDLF